MIFYGYYNSKFKKFPLQGVSCPGCDHGAMNMVASCRTYHVMFIPVFAGSKQITQVCPVCKSAYHPFPNHAEMAAQMRKAARRPWYLYFWLWLILAVALSGFTMGLIESLKV